MRGPIATKLLSRVGNPHGSLTVTQQVFAQTLPSTQLVLFGGFASTNQIAQRLVVVVRDPDRAEVAAPIAAGELFGIVAIGLMRSPAILGTSEGAMTSQ